MSISKYPRKSAHHPHHAQNLTYSNTGSKGTVSNCGQFPNFEAGLFGLWRGESLPGRLPPNGVGSSASGLLKPHSLPQSALPQQQGVYTHQASVELCGAQTLINQSLISEGRLGDQTEVYSRGCVCIPFVEV